MVVVVCWCGWSSRPGIFTDRYSALFKTLKPLIALRSAHTVLPVWLDKQLKCLCKMFTKFAVNFHTHTHTHTRCSSSSFIVSWSLRLRTAGARAQFSGCSLTTNAHSESGKTAVCCQNLPLGALSSRSAPSLPVGALLKSSVFFWTRLLRRACLNKERVVWGMSLRTYLLTYLLTDLLTYFMEHSPSR